MSVYSTLALMMISKDMTALTASLVTVLKLVSTSIARTIFLSNTLQQQSNHPFTMSSNPAYDSVAHADSTDVSILLNLANC